MRLSLQDLRDIVEQVTSQDGGGSLGPAVKKEVIHYLLFEYLDSSGFLDHLVFQGGTCLRDCYGALRLSEDLDFNVSPSFDIQSLEAMTEGMRTALRRSLETEVAVRPPKKVETDGGRPLPITKWTVVVETDPGHPDLPRQRVKLEVAQVPAYRLEDRFLQVRYPLLPPSLGDILIVSESLEEICADKLVAFALSPHLRLRDVWDLQWIAKQRVDEEDVRDLVAKKLVDYGGPSDEGALCELGWARIAEAMDGHALEQELSRFLPTGDVARTAARPRWREATAGLLHDLYEHVC